MSRQYLGWPCPHCGERKLDLGCVTIDTNPAVLGIECKACGKSGGIYENDPALLLDRENREPEAIVRALAEMDPFCRDGDCVPCREWLGGATQEWLEANDYDCDKVTPTTPRVGQHKTDCLWLRARKALGIP